MNQAQAPKIPSLETCRKGHEYTPENTYHGKQVDGSPRRQCKTCRKEASAAYYQQQKAYDERKRLLEYKALVASICRATSYTTRDTLRDVGQRMLANDGGNS